MIDSPLVAISLAAGTIGVLTILTGMSRARGRHQCVAAERHRVIEAQFRLTFGAVPIGMALVGLDGRFMRVNTALRDILGYTDAELLDTVIQEFAVPQDLAIDLGEVRRCMAGEIDNYEAESAFLRRDGRRLWLDVGIALVRDAGGAPTHTIVYMHDVTERHTADAALAASEARFAALVEHGSDLISISDAAGRLVYASPAYRTVLGIDPAERLGQALQDHIHPDDRPAVLAMGLALTATPGDSATIEFRYQHGDGSWQWVEATVTNLLDDPAVRGFVTNTRDPMDREHAFDRLDSAMVEDGFVDLLPHRPRSEPRVAQARGVAARYRAHLAESTEALVVHIDGVIVALSRPALALFEADAEEMVIGRHVFEFVAAESMAAAQARQKAVERGGWPRPEVVEVSTVNGRRMSVEVASTPAFWDGCSPAR